MNEIYLHFLWVDGWTDYLMKWSRVNLWHVYRSQRGDEQAAKADRAERVGAGPPKRRGRGVGLVGDEVPVV